MDYPKSVPNVGLVNGKFVDENTATGQVGSLIPSSWGNAVTDELLNVISSAELLPAEENTGQLLEAIQAIVSEKIPESPGQATETSAGIARVATAEQLLEGVDDSAFLTSKKVNPYIKKSIKDSVVKATEDVAGVAKVASQQMVTEGTDDNAFVTSLKISGLVRKVSTLEQSQIFKKVFTSTEQVITAGGYLAIAHGLGSVPAMWDAYITCKFGEYGYTPGSTIKIPSAAPDNSYNLGVSIIPGVTEMACRFGTQSGVFFVLNFLTGTTAIITPNNWRFVVRAWV